MNRQTFVRIALAVRDDWNGENDKAAFLRAVRNRACHRFATVLSPSYNRLHADHLHFDMGPFSLCR